MSRLTPPKLGRLVTATHRQLDILEWFSLMGLHKQVGLMQVRLSPNEYHQSDKYQSFWVLELVVVVAVALLILDPEMIA